MKKLGSLTRRNLLRGSAAAAVLLSAPHVRAQSGRKVVFWHSYTQKTRTDFMRATADRFEAANPGVKVDIEVMSWGAFGQRWPAARAANALPDVAITLGRNAIPMSLAGALHPTTPVLKTLGGPEAFIPGLIDRSCKFKDEYVSLPHYVHSFVNIYRKDRLEAAGLKVPVTWDDTLKAAIAMTKPPEYYGNILKLAKDDYAGAEFLWCMTRSAGGHFYDAEGKIMFDSEPVREATEWLAEIGKKTSGPGVANMRLADTFSLVNSGKQSMCNDSAAIIGVAVQDAPDVAKNLDATFMPSKKEGGYQTNLICTILPKGKNPDDAQNFLAFLYGEQNYMPFMTTIPLFMFPAYLKADMKKFTEHPVIGAYPNVVDATLKSVERGVMAGMDFGLNPYAAPVLTSGLVEDMLQRIILTNAPVKDEVAATAQKMDRLLQSIRSRT
jgi:multiple sugar transport system substrate-binding protein